MNIYHVYIEKELGIVLIIFGPVRLEEADIRAYGIVFCGESFLRYYCSDGFLQLMNCMRCMCNQVFRSVCWAVFSKSYLNSFIR